LRRAYFESRYGQLHVHYAIPAGGGFDESTTLLCLHQSPMSARVFDPLLKLLGRDRSVYAPDTPGYGESDAPPTKPSIADYAATLLEFVDNMRLRKVDLLGYHTGALIAAEIAVTRPELVRRLVLAGVPLLNETEKAAFRKTPWPANISEDGSHLLTEWKRSLQWRGPGVTLENLAASFAEKLRSGPQGHWGASAVMDYPAVERLRAVNQQVLVIRPKDDLWEATARARNVMKNASFVDLPQYGFGLFEVASAEIAAICREFLDRP
jgi:pimeloyl-ACP methyl ester carboxylesterase